jgi:tRNA-specific 2-thiouridylase
VIAIIPRDQAIVVGSADDLLGHELTIDEVNWLAEPLRTGETCEVQVRYRSRPVPAQVTDESSAALRLSLTEPVRAITPGQSGVLYQGTRLLGGGVIN